MHERNLANIVVDDMLKHAVSKHLSLIDGRKIRKMIIAVGMLHRVDKESFIQNFLAIAREVAPEKFSDDLEVDFEEIKVSAECLECGYEFMPSINSIVYFSLRPHTICIECGEVIELNVREGYGINIYGIEIE